MTQVEKLYNALGHLSVSFAEVEQNLRDILMLHISKGDDSIVGQYLTEDLPLYRLMELVKKIVRVQSVREAKVLVILKRLEPLRKRRNAFVHGKWPVAPKSDSSQELALWYTSSKIVFTEGVCHGAKVLHWSTKRSETMSLAVIHSVTKELAGIIQLQRNLLAELEDLETHEWD